MRWRPLLATFLMIAGSACNNSSPIADLHTSPEALPSSALPCPKDPRLGVYNPTRLTVLGACRWFKGVVTSVEPRSDGDTHIEVVPDSGSESFLARRNRRKLNGALVVEIMPGQRLPTPRVGEHVALLGTWVKDTHNGWNELHPVWAVQDLNTGGLPILAWPPSHPQYTPSDSLQD